MILRSRQPKKNQKNISKAQKRKKHGTDSDARDPTDSNQEMELKCIKKQKNIFAAQKKEVQIPAPYEVTEPKESNPETEPPEKIDDWEDIKLKLFDYKARCFVVKVLGFIITYVVVGTVGIGIIQNNWQPWQQMQVFVIVTTGGLLGYYFRK